MSSLLRRCCLGALALALLVAYASAARANESEESALNTIVELNKKALTLYDALEMEAAADLLKQALDVCARAKLDDHPTAARTHLHLGVVYLSGLKHRDLGVSEFRKALAIDPGIRLTKSLINPEVQAAFSEAQAAKPEPHSGAAPFPIPNQDEPATDAVVSGPDKTVPLLLSPTVSKAAQDGPVPIKAQVPPGMGAARVMLAYLADDAPEFLLHEMSPIHKEPGWFGAEIPSNATHGLQVAYYVEALDGDDRTIAASGSHEDPHVIVLLRNPNALSDGASPRRNLAGTAKPSKAPPPGVWIVLAAGSGAGYHAGTPEMNPTDQSSPPNSLRVSGLGLARLFHLAPEVGFFVRPSLLVSVQGRFQYVTGNQDVRIGARSYDRASLALAGLAKLRWLPRGWQGRMQPVFSVTLGAGQIRHTVTTPSDVVLTGCGDRATTCKDTVLGGPGLLGASAGIVYRVTDSWGLYGALDGLVGIPHFLLNGDLNLGIAITR
jgi:hypothetical protein